MAALEEKLAQKRLSKNDGQPSSGEATKSLIVLPEGFNLHRSYHDRSKPADYRPKILFELQRLSRDFQVTFLAALIVWRNPVQRIMCAPYNSGFLIDPDNVALVCHKKGNDESGNYCPYRGKIADLNNPVRRLGMAAVICMDVDDTSRTDSLTAGETEILCVPANTHQYLRTGDLRREERLPWMFEQKIVIVANSDPSGASFIKAKSGAIVALERGAQDEVCTVDLPHARSFE